MSNVIQFLASLGSDPHQIEAGSSDYAAMVGTLDIDDAQRQALLDRNHGALSEMLGGRSVLRCSIFSPDDDEQPAEPEGDEPIDAPSDLH